MLEHGAYTVLLDRYYTTEAGIPASQAHRLARASTAAERKAVDNVLEEFFVLVDGVWKRDSVEADIVDANRRIAAAKENGKKGGRPPGRTQKKPTGLPSGFNPLTQSKAHQTPDTNLHSSVPDGTGDGFPPPHLGMPAGLWPDSSMPPPPPPASAPRRTRKPASELTAEEQVKAEVWSVGKRLLMQEQDWSRDKAGDFLGKLIAQHTVRVVHEAVMSIASMPAPPADTKTYLVAACQTFAGRRLNKQELLEADNAAVGDEWVRSMQARMGGSNGDVIDEPT